MSIGSTDTTTDKLTGNMNVKYPAVRKRLLKLMKEDQADRRPGKFWGGDPSKSDPECMVEWLRRDQTRADKLLLFLEFIKVPSVHNIGLDGSRAAWLIAQHNPDYRNLGPIMLRKMKYLFYKDKNQVYYQGIPYLVDRLMLIRHNWQRTARQLYGTKGYHDKQGQVRSYPIIDRKNLLNRLKKFDLDINACIGLRGNTSNERAA